MVCKLLFERRLRFLISYDFIFYEQIGNQKALFPHSLPFTKNEPNYDRVALMGDLESVGDLCITYYMNTMNNYHPEQLLFFVFSILKSFSRPKQIFDKRLQ